MSFPVAIESRSRGSVVQKVAKRQGLNVKVIGFNDYVQPNAALDADELDANSF
jgi:D-methionine transport system substrate-binding protein